MTEEERKKVVEVVVDEANGRVPVAAGTSHTMTKMAVELSKHAEDVGADGLMIAAPYGFKPSEDEIYTYFKTISDSINIGIMIYNAPWLNKVDIEPGLMARLAELDNVVGLKLATKDSNMYTYLRLMKLFVDKFSIIDDMYLWTGSYGCMTGARGVISDIANYAPQFELKYWNMLERGEYTRVWNERQPIVAPYAEFMVEEESGGGGTDMIKAAMELCGRAAGPVRPPLVSTMSERRKKRLRNILVDMGVI